MKKGISILLLICALGISMAIGIFIGRTSREEYHPMPHKVSIESQHIPAHSEDYLIDINTAETDELMLLPLVGEGRAEDIIEYREDNGNFDRIEDIMQVSGIGEKTFEEIKEQITVGE